MTLLLINLLLAVLWVFLWGELSIYTLGVGLVGGYLVLWAFTRVRGANLLGDAYGRRLTDLFRFAAYFTGLLIKSNLHIAKEIVTPGFSMKPRFVRYDVTTLNDSQVAALSNAITLTPGTLVIDVRESVAGRTYLYVHCMYAGDRDEAVAELHALRMRMERDVFKPAGLEEDAPQEVRA